MTLADSTGIAVLITLGDRAHELPATLESARRAIEHSGVVGQILIAPYLGGTHALGLCDELREPGRDVLILPESASLSEAYTAGVRAAEMQLLAVLPSGDLIGHRFLRCARELLPAAHTPPIFVHPETVLKFGREAQVALTRSQGSGGPTTADILFADQWSSVVVGYRDTFSMVAPRTLSPEFGPLTWVWHIDTATAGITHVVAPGTVHLQRARFPAPGFSTTSVPLLPSVDVECLRRVMEAPPEEVPVIEQSAEGVPAPVPDRRHTRGVGRIVAAVRRRTGLIPNRSIELDAASDAPPALKFAHLRDELSEANALEPATAWAIQHIEELPIWTAKEDGYGHILENALDMFKGKSDVIVATPWLGRGGGDLVARNLLIALAELEEELGERVVLLTTDDESRTVVEMVPAGTVRVQLLASYLQLSADWRQRLIAQLFILAAPSQIFSVNCYAVTDALQLYGAQMSSATRILPTFFGYDSRPGGLRSSPLTDEGMRGALGFLHGIITDNELSRQALCNVIGPDRPPVWVVRQPISRETSEPATQSRALDDNLQGREPIRLVWPHRLDAEKGPEIVPLIARALRDAGVPATIDVWGTAVFDTEAESLLRSFEDEGVSYRGAYVGGLGSLPLADYHALLMTSRTEGLPLVLVEAMQRSIPVVCSNVGGVSELVIADETGLLVSGPEDLEGFVSQIARLRGSRDLRRRLVRAGYDLALKHHSWSAFSAAVRELSAR